MFLTWLEWDVFNLNVFFILFSLLLCHFKDVFETRKSMTVF